MRVSKMITRVGFATLFGVTLLVGCQDTVSVLENAEQAAAGKLIDDDSGSNFDRSDNYDVAREGKRNLVDDPSNRVGNDNGGNDNGGNDNGGNDNGGNGNSGDGLCADGSFKVDMDLFDGSMEVGDMEYREFADGCNRFRARAEGMAMGTYDVVVAGMVVGQIVVDSSGEGELEYDTADGTFPDTFPMVDVGDVGEIDTASGVFQDDCIGDDDVSNCTGNGNGNDNGGNDNGGNDNTGNENSGENGNSDDDNDNSISSCMEYVVKVEAELTSKGDEEGEAEYRLKVSGDERFRVKVEGYAPGTYDVGINDVVVGQVVVDGSGKGELEYRTQDGNFPDMFPEVAHGDIVDVDLAAMGVFEDECDGIANDNVGNDNGDNQNDDPADNDNGADDGDNANATTNG